MSDFIIYDAAIQYPCFITNASISKKSFLLPIPNLVEQLNTHNPNLVHRVTSHVHNPFYTATQA